jgi:hypothetical protein
MESSGIMESKKSSDKFVCELCNYKCSYNCDWTKHLTTTKHKASANLDKNGIEESSLSSLSKKTSPFVCSCGKSYSSKSNLGKHKKSCVQKKETYLTEDTPKMDIYDLVKYLMKENSDLKNMLTEQTNKFLEHGISNNNNSNNNNTTNTNSHNKAFNLQFFLNETCKNAMNITDFVDSIKLQLNDLINVGELGYVEGISNIIVKKLNTLDETERPIHCTDKKREIIYIKDEDKWEKDDEDKKKLRKVIGKVAFKNQKLFSQFKEKYPDYNDSDSKYSDQYSKIVIESLDDSNKEKQDKIIKKIAKEVLIEK